MERRVVPRAMDLPAMPSSRGIPLSSPTCYRPDAAALCAALLPLGPVCGTARPLPPFDGFDGAFGAPGPQIGPPGDFSRPVAYSSVAGDAPWAPLSAGGSANGPQASYAAGPPLIMDQLFKDSPWIAPNCIPPATSGLASPPWSSNAGSLAGYARRDHASAPSEYGTNLDSGYSGCGDPYSLSAQSLQDGEMDVGVEADMFNGPQPFSFDPFSAQPAADQRVADSSRPPPQAQKPPSRNSGVYCKHCSHQVKTKSERKRQQRQRKPFTCPHKECPASEKGFSTNNDLVRHKKSVHHECTVADRYYVCLHGPCAKMPRPKFWPRADNFRSHLLRVHEITAKTEADLKPYIQRQGFVPQERQGGRSGPSSPPPPEPSSINRSGSSETPSAGRPSDPTEAPSHSCHERDGDAGPPGEPTAPMDPRPGALTSPTPESPGSRDADSNAESVAEEDKVSYPTKSGQCESSTTKSGAPTPEPVPPEHGREPVAVRAEAFAKRLSEHSTGVDLLCLGREKILELLRSLPKECLQSALETAGPVDKKKDPTPVDAKDEAHFQCIVCKKMFRRLCEFKKHCKRHAKQYGCTYHGCGKKFGSKNDWKRHESSQHSQLETWNCQEDGCNRTCSRRQSFQSHLQRKHSIEDAATLERKLENCRIGRHCDPRFWCGFCLVVVTIPQNTSNMWTKRCDHIDEHLWGKGNFVKRSIEDWQHLQVQEEEDDDEEMPDVLQLEHSSSGQLAVAEDEAPAAAAAKRCASEDLAAPSPKRHRQGESYFWICCQCDTKMPLESIKTGMRSETSEMETLSENSAYCHSCEHRRCGHDAVGRPAACSRQGTGMP